MGVATVGIFALWYTEASFLGIDLAADGHTLVSLHQLMNWDQCHTWEGFKAAPFKAGSSTITFDNPCDYFTVGKVRRRVQAFFASCRAVFDERSRTQDCEWFARHWKSSISRILNLAC